jgi:hypothetical protein
MFHISEGMDLSVNCVHCGRAVFLAVAEWDAAPYQQSTWLCPYLDCQKINGITMAGRIDKVTADYGATISRRPC